MSYEDKAKLFFSPQISSREYGEHEDVHIFESKRINGGNRNQQNKTNVEYSPVRVHNNGQNKMKIIHTEPKKSTNGGSYSQVYKGNSVKKNKENKYHHKISASYAL